MAVAAICALSFLYCCVLFLKKTRHKIAVLFALDSLVLAVLFAAGAAAAATAAFILSAAAANVTVFFIPAGEDLPAPRPGDLAAIAANLIAAVLAAAFILKNPGQAAGRAGQMNPSITAFLFMAVAVAGYFIGSAAAGVEK